MIKKKMFILAAILGRSPESASARPSSDASDGGLFARPWMTTIGLMAVNVSLAAALAVSPTRAKAAQETIFVCNWCFEGYTYGGWVHAESKMGWWMKKYRSALAYSHRYDEGLYPGTCEQAHYDAACCDPEVS